MPRNYHPHYAPALTNYSIAQPDSDVMAGFVDRYQLFHYHKKNHHKTDAKQEAHLFKMLFNVYAPEKRLMAVIDQDDAEGIDAYGEEGYTLSMMNGDRSQKLRQLINNEFVFQLQSRPKHVVVVSDDTVFSHLCTVALQNEAEVSVWLPGSQPAGELTNFASRHLREMLPDIHIPEATASIWLDIENLLISLNKKGLKVSIEEFVKAIRAATANISNITNTAAYGDFEVLARDFGPNLQSQLSRLEVEPRYQRSLHQKNSADMKIASDIHTLLERDSYIQSVIIGTGDRDFRPVVDVARSRGKRVILLAVEGNLSEELKRAVDEVRYLDEYLKPQTQASRKVTLQVEPNSEWVELLMRFTLLLQRNRWKWAHKTSLQGVTTPALLQQAVIAEVIKFSRPNDPSGLTWNIAHPLTHAIQFWVPWITGRVEYLVEQKVKMGVMLYVDTHYLFKGMLADPKCKEFGIGQTYNNAAQWLAMANKAEVLGTKSLPHHKEPGKSVDTWWPIDENPVRSSERLQTADSQASKEQEAASDTQPPVKPPDSLIQEQSTNNPQVTTQQTQTAAASTAF